MTPPGGRWNPPTWADAQGIPPETPMRCVCRRLVTAGELRDLSALPALGQAYGCDGCLTRFERAGILSPLEFATAAGAPAHILAHLAAKDARRRERLGR